MNILIKKGWGANNGAVMSSLEKIAENVSFLTIRTQEEMNSAANHKPFRNPGNLPLKSNVLYLSLELNSKQNPLIEQSIKELLINRKIDGKEIEKDTLVIVSSWEDHTPGLFSEDMLKDSKANIVDFSVNNELKYIQNEAYRAVKEVTYELTKAKHSSRDADSGPEL
ncbi:hypothetical protein [Pseudomonas putida]|uniref:Uncharacterized protein n=1 Tax=Pseudomonas putida TaxID=303 RepID=A0A8I1EAW5_PSEPU|nr:hypothetical protein [Pseudomonas putida]MBI6882365.1 hypothetical protein [Pseudomonas putida]